MSGREYAYQLLRVRQAARRADTNLDKDISDIVDGSHFAGKGMSSKRLMHSGVKFHALERSAPKGSLIWRNISKCNEFEAKRKAPEGQALRSLA